MIAFLFIFGLAALLVVGGIRGSLHLRPHRRVSTGRRLSGLRRRQCITRLGRTRVHTTPVRQW
jgi:hypothetical protein